MSEHTSDNFYVEHAANDKILLTMMALILSGDPNRTFMKDGIDEEDWAVCLAKRLEDLGFEQDNPRRIDVLTRSEQLLAEEKEATVKRSPENRPFETKKREVW